MKESFSISNAIRSEEDLVSWIDQQREISQESNRLIIAQWIDNISAFHGVPTDDYDFITSLRNNDMTKKSRNELGKYAANWILPHVRTVSSKYISSSPKIYTSPASSDEKDVQASKMGTRFLEAEWIQQKMQLGMVDMGIWIGCIGNAFAVPYMDSEKGREVFKGIKEGQIVTKFVNPFKVVVERNRTNVADSRWFSWTERLPTDYVEEYYSETYEKRTGKPLSLSSNDDTYGDSDDDFSSSYLEMIGASSLGRNSSLGEDDSIDVTILFHVPTKRYPNGMYAAVAGNTVLMIEHYPYSFLDYLPLLHFKEIPVPWRLMGESSASQVLQSQDTYQKLRKIERDYHHANVNRKILAHKSLKIKNEDLQSNDNRVVRYGGRRDAAPPSAMAATGVPSTIFDSMNLAKEERDWSGGANESTHGMMPGAGTSGRAIMALQEQDMSRFSLTATHNEVEMAKWGKITLEFAKKFYTENRKYNTAGTSSGNAVYFFDKADINGSDDVVCMPGSMLPKSKIAERQEAIENFKVGVFGPPQDPTSINRLRKHIEYSMKEEIDTEDAYRAIAEKENDAIISMVRQAKEQNAAQTPEDAMRFTMPIQQFDNDELHVEVHLRRINSAGIVDNPIIYAAMGAHITQHTNRMMQNQQRMMQAQQGQPQQPPQQ